MWATSGERRGALCEARRPPRGPAPQGQHQRQGPRSHGAPQGRVRSRRRLQGTAIIDPAPGDCRPPPSSRRRSQDKDTMDNTPRNSPRNPSRPNRKIAIPDDPSTQRQREISPQPSHRATSEAFLRSILEDKGETYSTAEKISAIKELRILTGGSEDAGQGPGSMSRQEIMSELHRCRALLDGYVPEKATRKRP